MGQRIRYGKNTPLSFREDLAFSPQCPYTIRCKALPNDDSTPLHYGTTLEIGICCGVEGELILGNRRYSLSGDAVYAVPPGVIHATALRCGSGHLFVLHICLEMLSRFIGVEALLSQSEKSLADLPGLCPAFAEIHELVLEMIRRDEEPFARTRALMEVLELLFDQLPPHTVLEQPRQNSCDDALHRVLHWTEAHFSEPILLEQAAAVAGFARTYFCTWFKNNTGMTYHQYLNHVRLSYACERLLQTGSLASACYDSGFQDMSYFIQVFKKSRGCTPGVYLRNFQQKMPSD